MGGEWIIAICLIPLTLLMSFYYFIIWNTEREMTRYGVTRSKKINGKVCFKKFADNKFIIISGVANVGIYLLIILYEFAACFYPPMGIANLAREFTSVFLPLVIFLVSVPMCYFAGMEAYVIRKRKGIVYKKDSDGEIQYDDDAT